MKKCLLCNRTYSDETISFCLEDGSLLSASFNSHDEQETILRPAKIKDTPEKFFLPDENNEIATVFSNKTVNSNPARQPKLKINPNVIILACLIGLFLFAAVYTFSTIPLVLGFIVGSIYIAIWQILKRLVK